MLRPLPHEIAGRRVQTDFRKWLRVARLLDSPLDGSEKASILLYNLFGESPPENVESTLEAVMDFYLCGRSAPDVEPAPERLLDWDRDGDAVWADFRIYAGIDLDTANLHWWEFMALFHSLPGDAAIRRRMELRAVDLGKIKDPAMREEYRKMKRAVSVEDEEGS